ncbi:MAG TPA: outer-membrane lipoprotein carrier protein LolA [Alphaproteobacteria bacterium]|nr:outer-membrane lipoprotein carrier protein LolA [Alphaproteobacteria bacterium]
MSPPPFNRRNFLLVSAALAAAVWPGRARAALTPADQGEVRRVEDYLNGIKTLKARFLQVDSQGGTAEGTLYISRPGKLRVDYDPPNPNLLIANNGLLIHYDRALKAPAYLPLNSTPAGLLVRDHLSLSGDVTVLGVKRGAEALRVTVAQTSDPRAGQVTFVFGEKPFVLNSWQVTDAQGAETRVSLYNEESGISLDPSLFQFRDPATFGDSGTR